jgi:MFS family permease
VATIQATIYETFLQIDLLPWVGLSYAMAQASCLPLIGKLGDLVDYHVLVAFGSLIFATGSAVAGAAPSMSTLIVGRVIAGVGGACMLQAYVFPFPNFKNGHSRTMLS